MLCSHRKLRLISKYAAKMHLFQVKFTGKGKDTRFHFKAGTCIHSFVVSKEYLHSCQCIYIYIYIYIHIYIYIR